MEFDEPKKDLGPSDGSIRRPPAYEPSVASRIFVPFKT